MVSKIYDYIIIHVYVSMCIFAYTHFYNNICEKHSD